NIVPENLHVIAVEHAALQDQHGEGIDFLAGRTACAPKSEPSTPHGLRALAQEWQDFRREPAQLIFFSEKVRLIRRPDISSILELGARVGMVSQIIVVLGEICQSQGYETIAQASF